MHDRQCLVWIRAPNTTPYWVVPVDPFSCSTARMHAGHVRARLIARFRPQASRHVPSFVYIEPWDRLYRSVAFQGVI